MNWEYLIADFTGHVGTDPKLQELGEQGWELVAVGQGPSFQKRGFFKRPMMFVVNMDEMTPEKMREEPPTDVARPDVLSAT
jgi:hypothetical protein